MAAQILPFSLPASWSRGLTDQDCFGIARALAKLPGHWLAQRDERADGTVCMIMRRQGRSPNPAYAISRLGAVYHLRRRRPVAVVGRFITLAGAMDALVADAGMTRLRQADLA